MLGEGQVANWLDVVQVEGSGELWMPHTFKVLLASDSTCAGSYQEESSSTKGSAGLSQSPAVCSVGKLRAFDAGGPQFKDVRN